jgi:hypothetical protein
MEISNLSSDDATKYIKLIESSKTEEEIKINLRKLALISINQFNTTTTTSSLLNNIHTPSYKITQSINNNEIQLKTAILNNTENIIKMFNNIKDLKIDLVKSKKGVDSILSQMLM